MINDKIKLLFLLCLLASVKLSAQLQMIEVQEAQGIDHYYQSAILMGGGAAFFDYNNDGFDDIWINGGSAADRLFENLGDGNYIDVSAERGLPLNALGSTAVVAGDINNDSYTDVFVLTGNGTNNYLFQNNGNGSFTDISIAAGISADTAFTMSAALADINLDGFLDFYVGNYIEEIGFLFDSMGNTVGFDHRCYADFLYLNNGDLSFTKLDDNYWPNQDGCVLASTFTDFDSDGDPDLMVANDFGAWIRPNRLFRNNFPDNSFDEIAEEIGADVGIYGMGIAIGDYDLDSDLDYYITNLGRNVLLNNADNIFTDLTSEAGVEDSQYQNLNTVGWGTAFEDMNNDMYPDLLVANGYIEALDFIETNPVNPNKLYLNNHDGTFEDISNVSGFSNAQIARGLACSDVDSDGDVDVLLMNINGLVLPGEEIGVKLYACENENDNNWIQFSLEGTKNNYNAFGSRVKCFVGDKVLIKELNGGSSHTSQHSSILHFGLANHSFIDSVEIIWPGGKIQSQYNLEANQRHHIVEDLFLYNLSNDVELSNVDIYPNPGHDFVLIDSDRIEINYELYDFLGKLLLKGNSKIVNIQDLNSGVYHLKIISGSSFTFKHLMKQ